MRNFFNLLFTLLLATTCTWAADRIVEPVAGGRADADGKTAWFDAREIGIEGKGWLEKDKGADYYRLPAKAQGKA